MKRKSDIKLLAKKLELKRAILRQLTTGDLRRAAGGYTMCDLIDWPRPCGNPIYSA